MTNENQAVAHFENALKFANQNQLPAAARELQQALQIKPNYAEAYSNLGIIWRRLGNLEASVNALETAIKLKPNLFEAHFSLGNTLLELGQIEAAISEYDRASQLQPNLTGPIAQMAIALAGLGNIQAAADRWRTVIHMQPDNAEAHWDLSELLINSNNFADARAATIKYIHDCPNNLIMSSIAFISSHFRSGMATAAREKFAELEAYLLNLPHSPAKLNQLEIERLYHNYLFAMPHLRDNLAANSHLIRYVSSSSSPPSPRPPNRRSASTSANVVRRRVSPPSVGPLKIGIISRHFRRHAVGWCSLHTIQELSRITPHLYLYHTEPKPPDNRDSLAQIFQQTATKFYHPNTLNSPAEAIIREIRHDQIDVLIDLDAITVKTNIDILRQQPAPVCISWLGFDAPFITEQHYFLGDWHTLPPGREQYYQEQLLRMPNSFIALSGFDWDKNAEIFSRKALRIAPEQIVYLCTIPGRKINPETAKAQVQILAAVPDSVLIYKGKGDTTIIQSIYHQQCQEMGVGFHRIKFLPFAPTEELHRSIYQIADIFLDSYPYNGGTHTLEALWFNLPVVTHVGEQFVSRMGNSFLQTLGIEQGIAQNWEEYIYWGVRFGQDITFRDKIRQHLVQSKQGDNPAPLWNPRQFARDMYDLFAHLTNDQGSRNESF
ncbi:MAG: hypothetical protein Fur0025_06220 [Oscillatoriaceae cyanobacterium]